MLHDAKPVAKVYGGFSLRAGDGRNLTPKGLKERGVLALLFLQHEQRRTRASLQDMLWSDSPPAKGAANLRRALSSLTGLTPESGFSLAAR